MVLLYGDYHSCLQLKSDKWKKLWRKFDFTLHGVWANNTLPKRAWKEIIEPDVSLSTDAIARHNMNWSGTRATRRRHWISIPPATRCAIPLGVLLSTMASKGLTTREPTSCFPKWERKRRNTSPSIYHCSHSATGKMDISTEFWKS